MKKIILFIAVALAMVGCKEDDHKFSPEMNLDECKQAYQKNQKQIDALKKSLANKPEPQSYIIIDSTSTHPLPSGWSTGNQNKAAIAIKLPNGKYLVDLCQVYKNPDDPTASNYLLNDEKTVADWLKKNEEYINFNESSLFIEAAHILQHPIDLDDIKDDNPSPVFVQKDIKGFMASNSIADNQFDKYVKVSMDGSYTFSSSLFHDTDKIYAGPLFKSIEYNHSTANVIYKFAIVKFRGETTIIMEAVDSNNNKHIGYYDFTHRPRMTIRPRP